MARYIIDVDDELIKYFRKNVDDSESAEIMLSKLLKFLRELLEASKRKRYS